MNQEDYLQDLLKYYRPKGFDPFLETHRKGEEGLSYSSWEKYDGQEQIDERSVFPNELVIDIDEGDTEKRREETRQVAQYLENVANYPIIVGDTGGTGFHIHLFFKLPEGEDNHRFWRLALFDLLKEEVRENTQANPEYWDEAPVDFNVDESKGHLIRAFGGRKESTGHRKTTVTTSTLAKEEVEEIEEVNYPALNNRDDVLQINRISDKAADITLKELQEKAREKEEQKEKERKQQYESTYQAEDDGLEALREIPAQEVLKAFFDKDVQPGDSLYCVVHGSDGTGTAEATISDENTKGMPPGRYGCFGDSCKESGETIHWHNAIDLLTEGLDMDFQEAKQELAEEFDVDFDETTEGTEVTEATEPDSLVDSYLDYEKPKTVRLSGNLDDNTYFHTLFLERQGEIDKVVVTSDKRLFRVKNKLDELESDLDDGEKFEGDREKHDYNYFEVEGQKYKYKHKVATFSDLDLYTTSNEFLHYLRDEKPSQEVYDEVREEVRRYWDHYNDEWFDIATAWIIHTYLLDGIGYTAYLMLKGKEDTGKSTLQKILARLSYTGFFSGKSTSAVTSRLAHYTQASIHLDEFEKNADKETEGVYNTGQRKGAKYTFTNMNKDEVENQITALHSFCAKTLSVNSLYEFDNHFLSRNIILEATRTTRSLEKIENIGTQKKYKFQELRDELLAYALFNHEQILSDIENYREEIELSGREADKVGLISGVIKHFKGQQKADEVKEFLADKKELQEESLNQRLKVLFERIVQEFGSDDKEIQIKAKALAKHVNDELDVEDEYELSSRGVGNRLRDYDILRDKSQSARSGKHGETVYTIPRDFVIDSFTRYDLLNLRDTLVEEGNNSGSVASVTSVPSVDEEDADSDSQPSRPQKEIIETLKDLGAVGRDAPTVSFADLSTMTDLENLDDAVEELLSEGQIVEVSDGEFKVTA